MHSVSGFVPLVGDEAGLLVGDGIRYRAEDLVAGSVPCLLTECEPLPARGGRSGGRPDIMVAHPTRWDAHAIAALRDALDYAGLDDIALVSDAEATSAWYESEIADRPGQLVGIYHVDDAGVTVSLNRSGVPAGKAFRYTDRSGSPASQLATALGAFGWLPENLDAVVVTADGVVARDNTAIRSVAETISSKLAVHCVIGPGPEQTAALGAAIRATGFNPTTHRQTPIGLPPSYDITEVIQAIVDDRPAPDAAADPSVTTAATTPAQHGGTTEAAAVATRTAASSDSPASDSGSPGSGPSDAGTADPVAASSSSRVPVWALVAALVVVVAGAGVGAAVLL
ncbi:hypothetical protein Rrhod_0233 [Rhodococcus rhodnii LMG 5362]|uniref:Uncharacterized protein n=1 Tax=Rhodococcus rhodnii LMG 5362 TaxID=1273125 RepID=R7WW88_9NOCA|nr:hypothetical protein Rrhod_0233 [Rhodococcus rhodnii LMG 5362]